MTRVLLAMGIFLCLIGTAQSQPTGTYDVVRISPANNSSTERANRSTTPEGFIRHSLARAGALPVIGDYSPLSGVPGTVLTIWGTGFGETQAASALLIQSGVTGVWTTWTPTNWSDTEIVVTVPAGMPNGLVYMYVSVNGSQSTETRPFTVGIPPTIGAFSPPSGPTGTVLTIHGTGFGTAQGASSLDIQSGITGIWTTWKPTNWSDTEIVVTVPAGMPNGLVYFYVTVNGLRTIGTYVFKVGIVPVIDSFSPLSGPPGTVVTITGSRFGSTQGNSVLQILSAVTGWWSAWTPTSWSDTEIVVSVPGNMPLGKIYFIVEVNDVQSFGWDKFTVGVPPVVAGYSPLSGVPGTLLTIYGTGFGATQGSSYVSVLTAATYVSTTWPATSWSDTAIIVPVPSSMPLGKVYLSVTVDALQSIQTRPFTVGTPPVVTYYSPGSGPAGTILTITGSGFGATQGNSYVSFYSSITGASTTWAPTSWGDTTITVPVPSGTPMAKYYLSVTVNGLASIETSPFTVGAPPKITSYSPGFGPSGTPLTITGTGFGATQGRSYVSVYSTVTGASTKWAPTSWGATAISVPVPSSALQGKVYLYVTVDGLESIETSPFTVGVPAKITSYSPGFGPSGTALTITGTGFGAAQGGSIVSVYSAVTGTITTWNATSWSDTSIVVPVPSSAPQGKVYLYVTVDGLESIETSPFTVGVPPLITNYSPTLGPTGTVLAITGTGFGATQGSSYVSVYSTVTGATTTWETTSWSDTTIVVPVPTGVPPGTVYLFVTVGALQSIGTYPYSVQ
jgi:hypothetical protein